MADVVQQLEPGSYLAVKRPEYATEVVETDGGHEHHNSRWENSKPTWDVTIPFCKRTSQAYLKAKALFDACLGSGLTFTFHDTVDCEGVEVWILGDSMTITPSGNLVQVQFAVRKRKPD